MDRAPNIAFVHTLTRQIAHTLPFCGPSAAPSLRIRKRAQMSHYGSMAWYKCTAPPKELQSLAADSLAKGVMLCCGWALPHFSVGFMHNESPMPHVCQP